MITKNVPSGLSYQNFLVFATDSTTGINCIAKTSSRYVVHGIQLSYTGTTGQIQVGSDSQLLFRATITTTTPNPLILPIVIPGFFGKDLVITVTTATINWLNAQVIKEGK